MLLSNLEAFTKKVLKTKCCNYVRHSFLLKPVWTVLICSPEIFYLNFLLFSYVILLSLMYDISFLHKSSHFSHGHKGYLSLWMVTT